MAVVVILGFFISRHNLALKLIRNGKFEGKYKSLDSCYNLHRIGSFRMFNTESSAPKLKTEEKVSETPLLLSDSCINRLKSIQKETEYLRLSVEGGGCSGFQYTFTIDANLEADDCVILTSGVRVVVDQTSLEYVKGSTIDYQQELIRSAFRIVSNPQAEQGCSCGASFSIKI